MEIIVAQECSSRNGGALAVKWTAYKSVSLGPGAMLVVVRGWV